MKLTSSIVLVLAISIPGYSQASETETNVSVSQWLGQWEGLSKNTFVIEQQGHQLNVSGRDEAFTYNMQCDLSENNQKATCEGQAVGKILGTDTPYSYQSTLLFHQGLIQHAWEANHESQTKKFNFKFKHILKPQAEDWAKYKSGLVDLLQCALSNCTSLLDIQNQEN